MTKSDLYLVWLQRRLENRLALVYELASDHLAEAAPHGLIPATQIRVLVEPWHSVHARVSTEGDVRLIKISLGLIYLLHGLIRTLAIRTRVEGQEHSTADLVTELSRFIDRASSPMHPDAPMPLLNEAQARIAETHTQWSESFLLVHELAHAHCIDSQAVLNAKSFGLITSFDEEQLEREKAADLFGAWLLQWMASARLPADAGAMVALQMQNLAYAGVELTLRAVELMETYDPATRPHGHPTAPERIAVLRSANEAAGKESLMSDALHWERFIGRNSSHAVEVATQLAQAASQLLDVLLDVGAAHPPGGWWNGFHPESIFSMSRSGSMDLLLRELTTSQNGSSGRRDAALTIAEQFLPRTEDAFAPFWDLVDTGDGGWM